MAFEAAPAETDTNARILGEVVWLMSQTALHKNWPLSSVHWWIAPALRHNQYRVYRQGNLPVGYVAWAYMSEDVERRYVKNTMSLTPTDWRSGDRLWFIDFIAPGGGASAITKDLKENVFPDGTGRVLRWREGNDTLSIFYVHGKNAVKRARDPDFSPTVRLD